MCIKYDIEFDMRYVKRAGKSRLAAEGVTRSGNMQVLGLYADSTPEKLR